MSQAAFNSFDGTLILSEGVEELDDAAFSNYTGATERLILPSTLKRIGWNALGKYNNGNIDIILPENLEYIDGAAFYTYEGVQELTIPAKVKEIGNMAFNSYTGYELYFGENSQLKRIGESAFSSYKGFNPSKHPSSIGDETVLTIPSSVETIDRSAFSNYEAELDFSNATSLKTIGNYAFNRYGYNETRNLVLPEGLEELGEGAFRMYSSGIITFPSTLETIGTLAFGNYQNNVSLNFTNATSLKTIGSQAFSTYFCAQSCSFWLPSSVETIGERAFENYGGTIHLNEGLKTIGPYAFNNYRYNNVEIPRSVTTIGDGAFGNTPNTRTITVHSQELYDSRSSWAPNANVVYVP